MPWKNDFVTLQNIGRCIVQYIIKQFRESGKIFVRKRQNWKSVLNDMFNVSTIAS